LAPDEQAFAESGSDTGSQRRLRLLADVMAIVHLEPEADIPAWVDRRAFSCVVRTSELVTIVCSEALVPADIPGNRGWRALEVEGPLDLSLTGVLASLTAPLAGAGVPVFAISSYETDFILVQGAQLDRAVGALEAAGFSILSP
jgi:hypothetical protein